MSTAIKFQADILVETDRLSHGQWLNYRRGGIGGSDIAAICGLSKWRTPIHVYLEKLGEAPEESFSEAAEWGTRLEPLIADKFASEHPEWAITEKPVIYCHPEQRWALGNLDRMLICPRRGRGILEIKTASEFLRHEWDNDNIPDYYYVQLQWYMFVTGLEWGYFAALIGGNKYREYEVIRDDNMISQLERLAGDFWHHYVLARCYPPVDGSEACVKLLNPEAKGCIILPDEETEQIDTYLDYKQQIRVLEETMTEIENRFKSLLGEHAIGTAGGYLVKWQNRNRTGVDSKLLKDLHPDVYETCLKTTHFRQFSIKKVGKPNDD
ncbi:YqaJ viral recombinase family protein [Paenibacillus macerans]|uniref:YqaJ viral recombinase family nuclease n=1 Tax=Paenibacillus macerans TaxID=44252 RepID=UPI00203EB75E|nr:YqaJ viral recombinase family protein [Paenibacillus macerans]MCM3700330.1 YqaJ viral recombinase family protein [Paenibacillus macerans]